MQGFLKSLQAQWTAQTLSEGQSSDSQSSHAHLHTKLFSVLGLGNISSRCSIEIVPKWNLQNAEKPTPTPFLCIPSQAETSASCGVSLIPLMLVGSLSASDRMHTEISSVVTGGALTTLSNSL